MSIPTVVQVMEGIAARLDTIEGLRVESYVADQINPPQAVVGPPPIENYRLAFRRGTWELRPQVYILVSATLDRIGQTALASYADVSGPTSIPAAIEGDRATVGAQTLDGLVHDCVVESFRPLGMEEVGLIGYYGGVFELRVIASGT